MTFCPAPLTTSAAVRWMYPRTRCKLNLRTTAAGHATCKAATSPRRKSLSMSSSSKAISGAWSASRESSPTSRSAGTKSPTLGNLVRPPHRQRSRPPQPRPKRPRARTKSPPAATPAQATQTTPLEHPTRPQQESSRHRPHPAPSAWRPQRHIRRQPPSRCPSRPQVSRARASPVRASLPRQCLAPGQVGESVLPKERSRLIQKTTTMTTTISKPPARKRTVTAMTTKKAVATAKESLLRHPHKSSQSFLQVNLARRLLYGWSMNDSSPSCVDSR
mmetsp:Transcript_28283/g.68749  ORF Transcript_28283/g.68749 Transcript_28283/m.68749 type:complete len:275 (-) Transcript_28283:37-861(-)